MWLKKKIIHNIEWWVVYYLCGYKKYYDTREVLKWVNIAACSEPCTIQMPDLVVMLDAWSITKEYAVTQLNLV